MSRNERILKLVPAWADKVGKLNARKRLSDRGLGLSTVDQMLGGRYKATPGNLTAEILLKEMAKDGFVLTDDAS